MLGFFPRLSFWVLCTTTQLLLSSVTVGLSWCPTPPTRSSDAKFQQRTNRFLEFEEETQRWVEITLPFDLLSCINGNCSKVASIKNMEKKQGGNLVTQQEGKTNIDSDDKLVEEDHEQVLPLRKRFSLTRMSEASLWVTGQSGSIYERFWNGVGWVIAPHELPTSAGPAVAVFIVNRTIISLSEGGIVYQLQLNENSQPIWTELLLISEPLRHTGETEAKPSMRIKSGLVSHDGERLYFSTANGSLLEISEFHPLRWENNGRPPGGDVLAIADTGSIRPGIVFTISSTGDLYEFDKKSKPSWKKHIWNEEPTEKISLAPTTGCAIHGLLGAHSISLFLLSKDGSLIERQLNKRKWKWRLHRAHKGHYFSAITPVPLNDINEKNASLFLTTTKGFVYEYQLPKYSGKMALNLGNHTEGLWINHMHPQHAKIARGVRGVQIETGRIIFPLHDGRLGDLHLSGIGGEGSGPTNQISVRRKASTRYEWSVLDAPETEGWNAEYCTEERGPLNCIVGMKDVYSDDIPNDLANTLTARSSRKTTEHQHYISWSSCENSAAEPESNNFLTKSINTNFRMRVMHPDRSFFFITENGLTFEYLYTEGVWLWLRHELSTDVKGALGSYNGSLFLVDTHGSLLVRGRSGNELAWINCTAMRKGRQVASGAPWDGLPGKSQRVSAEDSLYFVNKKGRLLQFTVALQKFKWKDCHNPRDSKIAYIVDQEVFRMNIIFVVGRNGRLYQYNTLTELWHEHYQSPHLVLSRAPGTAMRPSPLSVTGSLFMISETGGLVEYCWNPSVGWEWIEHGTPYREVTLVGAPGPIFDGTRLFVIGSDGHVYGRHLDQRVWKWASYGYPYTENGAQEARTREDKKHGSKDEAVMFERTSNNFNGNCNEKVASIRPIPFSEESLIFELQDGRLAELRRSGKDGEWEWVRIIGTPTSLCFTSYWTAVAA
ncbi:uncharacterized protein M6B38_165810 [Iris pallida]|uniref:Uncharacterized protein n=1 Tax=Iris pallida TaxID=29817 RepID=A0AAX6EXB6_IRIPA|nr:uncharacterized protein M6B38_165810 [Iris pallida]